MARLLKESDLEKYKLNKVMAYEDGKMPSFLKHISHADYK